MNDFESIRREMNKNLLIVRNNLELRYLFYMNSSMSRTNKFVDIRRFMEGRMHV